MCHIGLEDFETFIRKTEEGIANLNQLLNQNKVDESIKLLKAYKMVKKIGLEPAIYNIYHSPSYQILFHLDRNLIYVESLFRSILYIYNMKL